jgi:hypothetical protein
VPSERRLDDGNTLWDFTACLPKSTFIAAARWRGSDFCSSFSVFSGLMLALGSIFLFDAFAHPLTADAGQILIGSRCLAFCFLAVFFLVRESR